VDLRPLPCAHIFRDDIANEIARRLIGRRGHLGGRP
jgi:hypothetical protein